MKRIVITSVILTGSILMFAQGLTNTGAYIKVANGTDVVVSDATDGDLTIGSGTFANYGDLYIESDLDNDGTLINGSDASGDGRISIASTGSVTGLGTSISERYYSSQSNDGSKPTGRWWYITPSVTNVTTDSILAADFPRLWQYLVGPNSWDQITGTGLSLNTVQGYATKVGSDQTISYTGDLFHHGTTSIAISAAGGGWNLVGNPYPAPIDFDPVATRLGTDIDPVIWTRTNSSFASYNSTSQIATNGGSRYIASMQGFWVLCTTNSTFEVQNGDKSMQSVSLLKSASARNNPMIRLHINGSEDGDEVVFAVMEGAGSGFERFDTRNKFGSLAGELYMELETGEQLAVNVINELPVEGIHKLGIRIQESGEYIISVSEFKHFPESTEVFLEDMLTGVSTPLSEGTKYSFQSEIATTADRFGIRFQSTSTVGKGDLIAVDQPSIYAYRDMVYIHAEGAGNDEIQVKVFDLMGKVVERHQFQGRVHYSFPLHQKPGVYIVQLNAPGFQLAEKIILSLSR